MKKISLLVIGLALMSSCKQENKESSNEQEAMPADEQIREESTEEQWTILFDGTATDAWHQYGQSKDSFPESWKIEDGTLAFYPVEGEHHDIVTDEEFESFELHIEWKISEGGNSGIMFGVKEMEQFQEPYYTGPEIQVLDNERHPDAKVNGKTHQAGALYDMVPPAEDVSSPAGEWNTYVIRIDHVNNKGSVTHNGKVVTEFPVHGEQWDTMVANSKFSQWEEFGKHHRGMIALQDHSDRVTYRNIKIRKL